MWLMRNVDLLVLAVAAVVFLAAGLPLLGYAAGAGAWVAQRVLKTVLEKRARATDDMRQTVGLVAGGMIGRGWLVAAAIFLVGVLGNEDDGLAAAILFLAVFSVWFSMNMALRPAERSL